MSSKQIKNLRSNLNKLLQKINDAKLIRSSTHQKLENDISTFQKKKLIDLTADLNLLYDAKFKFSVRSMKSTVETVRNSLFSDALPKNEPEDFKKPIAKDMTVKIVTVDIYYSIDPNDITGKQTIIEHDGKHLALMKTNQNFYAFSHVVKKITENTVYQVGHPEMKRVTGRSMMDFADQNESFDRMLENFASASIYFKIKSIRNTVNPLKNPKRVEEITLRKSSTPQRSNDNEQVYLI